MVKIAAIYTKFMSSILGEGGSFSHSVRLSLYCNKYQLSLLALNFGVKELFSLMNKIVLEIGVVEPI